MKKKVLAVLLAGVMAFALAACGSNQEPQTPVDTNAAEESTDGEEGTDAAGESQDADESETTGEDVDGEKDGDGDEAEASGDTPTLDAIRERGEIVLLTEATFPPFEYVSGTGFAGIDIDIGQEIADRLGVELVVTDMNFDLLTDALNADKGDFIAAGFTASEERRAVVDFTDHYVVNGLMVVVTADSEYASMDDLAGLKIGVQEATTGHYLAEDKIDTPASNILAYKSTVEAGSAVRTGKCDAAVIDKLPAESIVANSNGDLKLMEGVYEEEPTAIAVKKNSEDLLNFIQEVLDELEAEGKIQEFIDYHMVAAGEE